MEGLDFEQDAPTVRRPRGGDRHVLGLVLIGLGTVWFLNEAHLLALSAETVLSALLILLALGLIYTARWGRRMGRWPILLGVGLTVGLIANSPSLHFPSVRGGVGDKSISPQMIDDVLPEYRGGFGNLTIDLSAIPTAPLETRSISVHMVAGDLRIILPTGTLVDLAGRVRAGQLRACDQQLGDGLAIDSPYVSPGLGPHLRLVINAGFGNVTVEGCQSTAPTTSAPSVPATPSPPAVGIPGGTGPR